jgi:hypothetical protein
MPGRQFSALALLLAAALTACASGTGGLVGEARLHALFPQEARATEPLRELFSSERPLYFTLVADFEQLSKDREEENEERPARLLLPVPGGDTVDLPVQVRTRGHFRLQRATCSFPPLRLNFPEDSVAGTLFQGQDKLKLVTHCRGLETYEQNVVEELMTYRIYQLLTDKGFRGQLAFINYQDSGGKNATVSRLGFLLEDEEHLAERLGGTMVEVERASPDSFEPQQAGLLYLFQYMISNADWSVVAFHNTRALRVGSEYFPIPYDFDFSGLVDAPYAGPNPAHANEQTSVRDRLYQGFCSDRIDYEALFQLFSGRREAIRELIRTQPGLWERNADEAIRFLDEFFREIGSPASARDRFLRACKR